MEYIHRIDLPRLVAASGRVTEYLLDTDSGLETVGINLIRTPPGDGSPVGLHTHIVDQIFYVLAGLMNVEIHREQYQVGPGHLVVFPAGVPHRNWNEGAEATVHLAINTPLPSPDLPFATPYPAEQA
jgi:mannose-6-phosphate isomerase-like protein (cupin superfamily)